MRSLLNVPAEVVSANINAAVAKAAAKKRRIFVLGIMAGAFIAMGAQSSSLAVHNITDVGIARTLAGCIFPVGLMMIVFVGGELFTGDCMMSMACMKGRIGFGSLLRTLLIVYLGNFAGAVLIAFLVAHSMLHLCGYDHMEEEERLVMEERQREILNTRGYTR